jgi:hypothetical protein
MKINKKDIKRLISKLKEAVNLINGIEYHPNLRKANNNILDTLNAVSNKEVRFSDIEEKPKSENLMIPIYPLMEISLTNRQGYINDEYVIIDGRGQFIPDAADKLKDALINSAIKLVNHKEHDKEWLYMKTDFDILVKAYELIK